MEILGSTIQQIASEKAGIIKPQVTHLIGLLDKQSEKVMRNVCKSRKADLVKLNRKDFSVYKKTHKLDFDDSNLKLKNISPGLWGEHQLQNAALTIKACELLQQKNFKFSKKAIRVGLEAVEWAGRFQVVKSKNNNSLVLDVCHNYSGAKAFVSGFKTKFPGRKTTMIIGLVKRKEHQKIITELAKVADSFLLVPMKTKRSTDLGQMIAKINWLGCPVSKFSSLKTAWSYLLKTASPDDIISVTGSHYLVGEFLGTIEMN